MQSLVGHRKRVRVLTIQHEAPGERQASPEVSIERYQDAEIEKIMQANYVGLVPSVCARMCTCLLDTLGLLSICANMTAPSSRPRVSAPAELTVRMYYEERAGVHREDASALALFTRVGREGDVAEELDALVNGSALPVPMLNDTSASLSTLPDSLSVRLFTIGLRLNW